MASMLAFAGVSRNNGDPSGASTKHVYAEGEAPYLRTNASRPQPHLRWISRW